MSAQDNCHPSRKKSRQTAEGLQIIYTGHGGQDRNSGKQVSNQEFTRGNKALAINNAQGFPVRVIRGSRSKSEYAPSQGFRYDGLFRVEEYWHEIGRSGFIIWRYRLVSDSNAERISQQATSPLPSGNQSPKTKPVMTTRVIRSSEVALAIKNLYEFSCQICGVVLNTPGGPYAEGAHIKPLGAPHLGPDTPDNILCLCPNHHVLFDCGAIKINNDMQLVGAAGQLRVHNKHIISSEYLQYHREHFGAE